MVWAADAKCLARGKMAREDARPTKAGSTLAGGARLLTSHREAVWCAYYPNKLPLICVHLRLSAVEFSIGSRSLTPDGRRLLAVSFGCGVSRAALQSFNLLAGCEDFSYSPYEPYLFSADRRCAS